MHKSVQEVAVNLYSYVVEHDTGYAPNPYFGFCTLCRCKFRKSAAGRKNIVELAKEGDWVIGTGGASKRSAGHGKLVYAMLVTEKLTREKYSSDSRFAEKKPVNTSTSTYERKRGDNKRPRKVFEKREQFVLISRHFYYFGSNAISRQNSASAVLKGEAVGSAALSIQRVSAGLSTGSKRNGNRGNSGSRARSSLMNRKEARDASRPAESRYRHGLWGNSRPALQRWFI
jgi:hypothetical protein